MITQVTSIAVIVRQARAIVPFLIAGALAAGCGTTHAPAGGPAGTPAGTPAGGGTAVSPSGSTATASSSPRPAPVQTVTGGAVAGETACAGWPENVPRARMSALFKPVTAERCVIAVKEVPGKGEWQTATMEKAAKNLGPLVTALLRPSASHTPGTFCPDLAILPPQIVVINAAGDKLIPVFPLTGCDQIQPQALTAIASLDWQPVSVRLIAPVPGNSGGTSTTPGSPKAFQMLPAVAPHDQAATVG